MEKMEKMPKATEEVVEKKKAPRKPKHDIYEAITRVNLREKPNLGAKVVRIVEKNEEVRVKDIFDEDEQGQWAVVDQGFVKLEYLEKVV